MQVLPLCRHVGHGEAGACVLDGTKVRANALNHKAMNYKSVRVPEAQLSAEVDDEEDRRYGQGRHGDELPQELSFREGQLEKILEAMAELETEV